MNKNMDETGFTANGKNEWRYATPASSRCARAVLAFDIETTGLHPAHSVVTVVCTQDYHTGERRAYEFGRVRAFQNFSNN